MKTESEATPLILDKADPSVAEVFQNCKPGDTYEVVSADDNEVTLKAVGATEEAEEPTDEVAAEDTTEAIPAKKPGSSNPAVAKLMEKY